MEHRRVSGKKWVLGASIIFISLYLIIFLFVYNVIEEDSAEISFLYMHKECKTKTINEIKNMEDSFIPIKDYRRYSQKTLFYHPEWVILDVKIAEDTDPDKRLFFCHYPFAKDLKIYDDKGELLANDNVFAGSLSNAFLSPHRLPLKNGRYFVKYGSGIRLFHSYAFLTEGQSLRKIFMLFFVMVGLMTGLVFSAFAICITFFIMSREKLFLQSGFLSVFMAANLFIFTDIVGVCSDSLSPALLEKIRLITEYGTLTLAAFYVNSFLGIPTLLPKLYKSVSVLSLCFLLPLSFLFFTDSVVFFGIFLICGRAALLIYFFIVLRKCKDNVGVGDSFFTWGWVFYFIGWILYYFGLLPFSFYDFLLNTNLWVGFSFLILYNDIALIDRMQFLGLEKSAAEKRLSIERSRIASEIHDSVGADFSVFVQELLANPEKRYTAKKVAVRLQLYLERIRDIVYMLNRDYDLASRFEVELISRIHRLERLNKFSLDYKIDPSGEIMGLERCYHILRITDEWIANILKHSKPKTIKLRFISMEAAWKLVIMDDGVGLDWYSGTENAKEIKSGQGLASIIWRAHAIKGFAMSRKEEEFNRFELVIPGRTI